MSEENNNSPEVSDISSDNINEDTSGVNRINNEEPEKKRSLASIVVEIAIYAVLIVACVFLLPKYVVQRTVVDGESMEDTLHDGESLLVEKISYRFHDPERYDIVVFYPNNVRTVDDELDMYKRSFPKYTFEDFEEILPAKFSEEEVQDFIDHYATYDDEYLKKTLKIKDEEKPYYVKRIFGLPGETVRIENNTIYINGEPVDDPYAKNATDEVGIAKKEITLGEDEFFVLGDNRQVSLDSRKIPREKREDFPMYTDEELEEEFVIEDGAPGLVKRESIEGRVFLRIWPLSKFGFP